MPTMASIVSWTVGSAADACHVADAEAPSAMLGAMRLPRGWWTEWWTEEGCLLSAETPPQPLVRLIAPGTTPASPPTRRP